MAKMTQGERGAERIVTKSKSTLNLVSHDATSSSIMQRSIATKSPGTLRTLCQQDWKSTGKLVAREPNQDATSSSQVWQKDAEMDKSTMKLVANGNSTVLAQSGHTIFFYIYTYSLRSRS